MGVFKHTLWILAFATCVLAGLLNRVLDQKQLSNQAGVVAVVLCLVNALVWFWDGRREQRKSTGPD